MRWCLLIVSVLIFSGSSGCYMGQPYQERTVTVTTPPNAAPTANGVETTQDYDYSGETSYVDSVPEPPALRYEYVPDPPSPDYVWIPGYWRWSSNEYIWISGRYSVRRAGLYWRPPTYLGGRYYPGRWLRGVIPSWHYSRRIRPGQYYGGSGYRAIRNRPGRYYSRPRRRTGDTGYNHHSGHSPNHNRGVNTRRHYYSTRNPDGNHQRERNNGVRGRERINSNHSGVRNRHNRNSPSGHHNSRVRRNPSGNHNNNGAAYNPRSGNSRHRVGNSSRVRSRRKKDSSSSGKRNSVRNSRSNPSGNNSTRRGTTARSRSRRR
ncbi:MAG: YXWGXW repeat-containing protein [Deltaproteobacteria bacterium]|nr:YXWGXW repeat-containing protein [Deltaproteobacteria bacterium]